MVQQMADSGAQDDDTGEQGVAGQGICIEIQVLPDGTFNVSSEPLQEEAEEENCESGEEKGQTASSIGDALKIVLSLYRENAPSDSTAQQQFQAGYSKAGS